MFHPTAPDNASLWDAAKAVLRGKFIMTHACIKKKERIQINNLSLQLKVTGRKKKTKPKLLFRNKEGRKFCHLGQHGWNLKALR